MDLDVRGPRAGCRWRYCTAISIWRAFEAARLHHEPYDWLVVPDFVRPKALAEINADYPTITGPTAFMIDELECGPPFIAMVEQLKSDEFAERISAKFGLDVAGLPRTISVRRFADRATAISIRTARPKSLPS